MEEGNDNEQPEKKDLLITKTNLERKWLTEIKPDIAISGSKDTPNALHCAPE